MHLEGSLSPELLFTLSKKNNIPLPSPSVDPAFSSAETLYTRYENFSSLDDFLHYYYIGFSVLLTESDFEELSYAYLVRAALEANVRHAEVFFDPQAHLSRGISVETIIRGWEKALERVQQQEKLAITALLIPCLLRHLDVSDSEDCFQGMVDGGYFFSVPGPSPSVLTEKNGNANSQGTGKEGEEGTQARLAGLGLCSTEIAKPPSNWGSIFRKAKELGVRRTSHAGEEGPAGFVSAALDELEVERIDHGVHAADDPALLDRLAREKILLTVCPVSNVRLKGFSHIGEVPLRKLLEKGVRFSLNSDDPAYFGAYLQEVYCRVEEEFELGFNVWGQIAKNGVEGSWCDEERKKAILEEIDGLVGEYGRKEEEEGLPN